MKGDTNSAGPRQGESPFNAPEYDFSVATVPRHFYMIASTPRAGGTYLAQCLWRTGIMGAPHEYFGFYSTLLQMSARLQARTLVEYFNRLLPLRTSANGVFGIKTHFDHLQFMMLAGILERLERLTVIAIERRDTLAQAASHARALQTNQWTSLEGVAQRAPEYDPKLIAWCQNHLAAQRQGWRDFFAKNGLSPIAVDYDDFLADPDATTRGIVERARFPDAPVSPTSLPETTPQSDALNAEWIERYRSETAADAQP